MQRTLQWIRRDSFIDCFAICSCTLHCARCTVVAICHSSRFPPCFSPLLWIAIIPTFVLGRQHADHKYNPLMQIISWHYYGNDCSLHCCPFVIICQIIVIGLRLYRITRRARVVISWCFSIPSFERGSIIIFEPTSVRFDNEIKIKLMKNHVQASLIPRDRTEFLKSIVTVFSIIYTPT